MPAMLRLSPSDFAFLWEQCKRCFYLKVVHGIRQPSMPMAARSIVPVLWLLIRSTVGERRIALVGRC